MRERNTIEPDTLPSEALLPGHSHPTELGGIAVTSTAQLEEEGQTPLEFVVDAEQLELERKRHTTENLKALQKRFGERFVKGELMEGGGYTGGAARELLAGFIDRPGFASELKRLIPSKYGALQLLKDNYAYIQATLEQFYKDDPTLEREPAKDPYEIARSVGYELTGPFESTREFVPFDKKDFREGERLCTFNYPEERLRNYHILWLRHNEIDNTLPADQLTVETLSDAWRTYFKTVGRYDQDTDIYDLTGLRPIRDDPYGTSSMSVQISREGTHVSIKNRYNHAVGNPDNTLDSDLDHVSYGLRRAVYSLVGREDLLDKTRVVLAEGYIADNEGGIHAYNFEEDNSYYGDYEYIENGVVTIIDRGAYYMISPQLYVPKSGKGEELRLGQRKSGDMEAALNDVRFLYKNTELRTSEKDLHISELRRIYVERDKTELDAALSEAIREQLGTSFQAYGEVSRHIGEAGISRAEFDVLFAKKEAEWRASGVYDELVERFITDGIRFNLLAPPNIEASETQIIALAEEFGKKQPYKTYVYDVMYRHNRFESQQLSGYNGREAVRFSLIEATLDPRLSGQTAEQQKEVLTTLQSKKPALNIRVPSVLDGITNWFSLRVRGDKLADSSAYDKTFVRHFDLPEQQFVDWLRVPLSYVGGGGGPDLSFSYAGVVSVARVLLG